MKSRRRRSGRGSLHGVLLEGARRMQRPLFRHMSTSRRRFMRDSLTVAAVLPVLPKTGFAAGEVNVYNWDTYIGEDTVSEFASATGTDVRYDLYADNDELFAKIREGNPGYDVIFPSNDYVERMVAADLLVPLDHSRIGNIGNIDPLFMASAFDQGRKFSLPYFWGTMGVGFRKSVANPTSWKALFEPTEHQGRIALLNSPSVIQIAMKYLGYSLNETNPDRIEEAVNLLIASKSAIKAYAPDTGQDMLIGGEVDIALEWNGDILQVMLEDDDLSYVMPEEGSIIWEDTMCIPTGAPNIENAHAFIDYILTAEVHGQIANEIQYACPNLAAKAFINEADLKNPAMYPPAEVLAKCEASIYQGEEVSSLLDGGLTKVLAA